MSEAVRRLYGNYLKSIIISVIASAVFVLVLKPDLPITPLTQILCDGFVFGSLFFSVGTFLMPRLRSQSFTLTVVTKALVILATLFLAMLLILSIALSIGARRVPWDIRVMEVTRNIVSSPIFLNYTAIAFLVTMLVFAFFQLNTRLGPGVLWNLFTGKYHDPREEERIFMFLDLKDSTSLGEQLGNLKFSALVRDFFTDLTLPVLESKGEVSHYIGDEAVITWTPKRGLHNANCIQCFMKMREAVGKRADYYRSKYGVVPQFKAGLHIGPVIATQVGEIKSEIVYHGDVLNTAARLESLCNGVGYPLLLTAELAERLPAHVRLRALGEHVLRGKGKELAIFTPAECCDDTPDTVETPDQGSSLYQ